MQAFLLACLSDLPPFLMIPSRTRKKDQYRPLDPLSSSNAPNKDESIYIGALLLDVMRPKVKDVLGNVAL